MYREARVWRAFVAVINKDWAEALNEAQIERVLSLGVYNLHAKLLFVHVDEWWHTMFRHEMNKKLMTEAFRFFFIPYYKIWASTVYVVHEGIEECGVTDKKLDAIRGSLDMRLFRRFRNGTFHFQPRLSNAHHRDYIDKAGFGMTRELYERQDFVVRKMVRLLKHNPLYHGQTLRQLS